MTTRLTQATIVLCFIAGLIVTDRVIAGMTLCRAAQTCPQGGR